MLTLLANLLRTGIYKVDGEALDAVTVRRDAIQVVVEGKSTLIGTVNGEFLTILSLGKESRETKRQLMVIDKLVKRRNDENLQAVSHAFKISIHEKMVALLNATTPDKQRPSVRHLLLLEREIFIFFSLLSGKTAHLILISALTEYGDPKSGIYGNLRAATYLPVFLQHLKILVRGVAGWGHAMMWTCSEKSANMALRSPNSMVRPKINALWYEPCSGSKM